MGDILYIIQWNSMECTKVREGKGREGKASIYRDIHREKLVLTMMWKQSNERASSELNCEDAHHMRGW
jgi:hypothetical protein